MLALLACVAVASWLMCLSPLHTLLGAPTLSRLLEAGPAQFTTSLTSFSAVTSEPPAKLLPPPVESVSQTAIVTVPTLPAPAAMPPTATPESVASGASLHSCHLLP